MCMPSIKALIWLRRQRRILQFTSNQVPVCDHSRQCCPQVAATLCSQELNKEVDRGRCEVTIHFEDYSADLFMTFRELNKTPIFFAHLFN